jgi:hypothetical protein
MRCVAKHPVWGRCDLAFPHGGPGAGDVTQAHCVALESGGRRVYQRWADGLDWPEPAEARHLALPWAMVKLGARRGPRLDAWTR